MLIAIIVVFGGIIGIGHALNIYYEIKNDKERKRLDAEAAKARATRKYYL